MKDKQGKKLTMKDLHEDYKESSPVEKQIKEEIESIKVEITSKELEEEIKNYNANIRNLDPLYTSVVPIHDVIVRMFLIEPTVSESGLVSLHKEIYSIPTRNEMASYAEAESPFPYSRKAIVVSAPENSAFKKGNIVQIAANPVTVAGNANNAYFKVKMEYLHPDANLLATPKNPSSQHYGYLMLPSYDIKAILQDV
jgi:hypothetical protein